MGLNDLPVRLQVHLGVEKGINNLDGAAVLAAVIGVFPALQFLGSTCRLTLKKECRKKERRAQGYSSTWIVSGRVSPAVIVT